jgi:putative lipoic acid-binding regulatory protein
MNSQQSIVAVLEASGVPLTEPLVTRRPSREGTYLALGLTFNAKDADHVLEVYELIRGIDDVIMCL